MPYLLYSLGCFYLNFYNWAGDGQGLIERADRMQATGKNFQIRAYVAKAVRTGKNLGLSDG